MEKKKIIIIFVVIIILVVLITTIIIQNIITNSEINQNKYLATSNENSGLVASYIKKGMTIGGITGTLESLDTSDANATPEDILEGKTAYAKGMKITGTRAGSTISTITGEEKNNTETKDRLGNKIVIPAGFKVVNASDTVEDGIIIEDVSAGNDNTKGSQFVWIPVGNIKKKDGQNVTITLDRHNWATIGGGILPFDGREKEETIEEHAASGFQNAIAKDINAFKMSVSTNGGYYIARYEAGDNTATLSKRNAKSGTSNPVVSKALVYPYNYVTQIEASNLARNMYLNNNFISDLMNSYAFDTALAYIQNCGKESNSKTYSVEYGINVNEKLQYSGANVLKNGKADVQCNIYDLAGGTEEFTTETNSYEHSPCTSRGSYYGASTQMFTRRSNYTTISQEETSFRCILYLQ